MSRLLVRAEKLVRALLQRRAKATPLRRILVAHNLLLGDTVLLAPLLKALAALAPEAERFVMCRPAFMPLFANRPYGFTALPFSRKDAKSQRRIIASGPYDLAIIPDDNRYAWLARAAGARWISGFADDQPPWKNFMLDHAMPYPSAPGAWADMLPLLAGVATVAPFVAGEWPAPAYQPFAMPRDPYVVLHVGASTVLKQWPAARWRIIADQLRADFSIVWSGADAERHILDAIAPPAGEAGLFGTLELGQLWHLLAGARLLVCPDTGIAHLARIIGTPGAAIFGPGSAVVHGAGTFWRESRAIAVTVTDFPCRDQRMLFRRNVDWVRRCGRTAGGVSIGPKLCPEPLCMQAVTDTDVQHAIDTLLASERLAP